MVPGPVSRGKRDTVERLTGQKKYPVIEFEDGSVYGDDSKAMTETIESGRLDAKRAPTEPAA